MADGEHKLFVGIDYGTTFTGVSWVNSMKKSIDDIEVIRTWPGPSKEAEEVWKAPSKIAYPDENSKVKKMKNVQWGYQVVPKMRSYAWTKLLLDSTTAPTGNDLQELEASYGSLLCQLPEGKTATEVVGDYLKGVHQWTMDTLDLRLSPEIVRLTPIHFIFTVPAIWSDRAKAATLDAAKIAGFANRTMDEISMISEPEAAAVASLTALAKDSSTNTVKKGDGILICDCGGGTVDVTTYLIQSLQPFAFKELVVGEGGKCGSTFIDREFFRWLSITFGKSFDTIPLDRKGPGSATMKAFETCKRDLGSSEDADFEVLLPMKDVDNDHEHYDHDTSAVIFDYDVMESFFKLSVGKIITIVEQQTEKVKFLDRGTRITTVVVVGGFGESRYLNDKLRTWCGKKGIRLLCPTSPQAAIVKGAALSGLIGMRPSERFCRRHYGFDWAWPFRQGIDPEEESYIDPHDNQKRCAGRMQWLIAKGWKLEDKSVVTSDIRRPWVPGEARLFADELYSCNLDIAPEYVTSPGISLVGTIKLNFTGVPLSLFEYKMKNGKKTYQLEYKLQVMLGSKEGVLQFKATAGGRRIGTVDIDYSKGT